MSRFDAIDLSQLPKPGVIDELDFEIILARIKANHLDRNPEFSADLESEPLIKLLETAAYRELTLRAAMNDDARSVMLAFATGTDLDHVAARYGVARLIVDPGNPDTVPPVVPTHEGDDAYRRRIQLAPEALTVAGSRGGYVFNALSAGQEPTSVDFATPEPGTIVITHTFSPGSVVALIKDANPYRSDPGEITVPVMGWLGDGVPDQVALDAVEVHLGDENVRPLGDTVIVRAVEILNYTITAVLEVYDGPEAPIVEAAARAAVQAYVDAQHKIAARVTDSGLHEAMTVVGVEKVRLTNFIDITPEPYQAAYCTDIILSVEVPNG